MSSIIRGLRGSWTPPPGRSADVRVPAPLDTYSFLQNQIESEQRQAQRSVSRTVRAGNINAAPSAPAGRSITDPGFPNFIINLPLQ